MTRAQNSFVDEQLARIQTTMTPVVVFADHKTIAPRPASTYDLPRKKQNLPHLREAPAREFEAICQHMTSLQPYMVVGPSKR